LTREELKQIYYLNKEVKMWQRELDRLQCKSLVKGQEITGMPHVPGISDKVGEIATAMADIEAIIRGKLAEIQIQRKKIMEYINNIDDSIARQVIFLRCVSNLSFYDIAKELGDGYTYDAVRQIYYRRLKKDGIK
jgi:hypothetical protein